MYAHPESSSTLEAAIASVGDLEQQLVAKGFQGAALEEEILRRSETGEIPMTETMKQLPRRELMALLLKTAAEWRMQAGWVRLTGRGDRHSELSELRPGQPGIDQ